MIDWVTCQIPFVHPYIAAGKTLHLDHDDVLQKAIPRRRPVQGTHSSTFTVRSCGAAGDGLASYLSLSGNPSKFLQGHNVFGSDDILSLIVDVLRVLDQSLSLGIDAWTYRAVENGEYDLSTVDINYSYELPCQTDVQTFIRELEMKTRSRCGRPSTVGGTVYWQKNSRRWAMKCYSKWQELFGTKDHQLPLALQCTPLHAWTENKLRIELRLKSLELHDLVMTRAKDFAGHVRSLFAAYQGKLSMPTQLQLFDKDLHDVPPRLMLTYHAWKAGHNVMQMMSKATFYRHRKQLMEHGIDISIAMDRSESSNVIPFIRVLEAKPASIPEWAFEQGLVHHSAKEVRYGNSSGR